MISDWVATKSVDRRRRGRPRPADARTGRPLGRRPARRGARRRRQRVAARRQGRCACCAWPSGSARSRASSRRARCATQVADVDVREVLRAPGLALDGRAPRRRARAARLTRRRHPHRAPGPQRGPPLPAGRRLRRTSGPTARPPRRTRCAEAFGARSRSTCTPARSPGCCPRRSTWPVAAPRPRATSARQGELLDADGAVLATADVTEWNGWLREVPGPAAALRIRTTVRLDEPGRHEVGVGTVGKHVISVGGQVLSTSDTVVGAEVILDSSVNQPPPATLVIDVTEPTTVEVDAAGPGRAPRRLRELRARRAGAPHARHLARRAARGRRRGRRRGGPRHRRRRDQRGDRVRGLRPHEPRAARHAGPAGQGDARREPEHDRRRQRRRPGDPAVARRGPVRRVGVARRPGVARGARRRAHRRHRAVRPPAVDAARRTSPTSPCRTRSPSTASSTTTRACTSGTAPGSPSAARPPPRSGTAWAGRRGSTSPRRRAADGDGGIVLDVVVRNTGTRAGREVVQVYVEPPESSPRTPGRASGALARRFQLSCTPSPARTNGSRYGWTHVRSAPGTRHSPAGSPRPVPTRSAWAVRQATYVSRSTWTSRGRTPTGPDPHL